MFTKQLSAVALLCALPGLASATTISVSEFDGTAFGALVGEGTFVGEDFEDEGLALGEGEVGANFDTSVGTFNTLGGTGTGGTVTGLAGNTGTELALRDGNVFGRVNTTPTGGSWFIDSNDTNGIAWDVELDSGEAFNSVLFTLTDGSDTGAFLRIVAGTETFEQRVGGRLSDGNSSIVLVEFGEFLESARIEFRNMDSQGNYRNNDGFSLDGMRVGVLPVPLPASGLLFIGALGALALRARKTRS